VLISSSKLCKNQAFRFKNRLFGFQYHFEFTEADIEAVMAANRDETRAVLGAEADTRVRQDTARYYSRYARLGDRVLQNFVQFLKMY
jgi:GMP synthase-like glutamine amidotransferase